MSREEQAVLWLLRHHQRHVRYRRFVRTKGTGEARALAYKQVDKALLKLEEFQPELDKLLGDLTGKEALSSEKAAVERAEKN